MKEIEKSFLQTPAWGDFQRALGREIIEKSGAGWSYLAAVERGTMMSRLHAPYGPTVNSPAALKAAIKDLKTEAKSRKLDIVRAEPVGNVKESDLLKLGLKRAQKEAEPADTAIGDVSISEEEIIARAKQNNRNLYRKNLREGVKFVVSYNPKDIGYFLKLIKGIAKRAGMIPFSDDYYSKIAASLFLAKSAGLIFAELKGKKIAAMIFYKTDSTMIYAHAAADDKYRKLSPATALVMEAQIIAHNMGLKNFDFFGIAPENALENHRWAGFTKFKLSFGSERKKYLGTWELPLKPVKYKIYNSLLSLKKLLTRA